MGSGTKPRWKFPGFSRHHHRRSADSPAGGGSPSPQSTTPAEFICPISGRLMAEPVILPNGQTFERACIVACLDLGIDLPLPHQDAALPPPPPLSPSTQLVPNFALRSAILNWCDSHGIARPVPLDPAAAARFVQSCAAATSSSCDSISICSASPSPSPSSSLVNVEKDDQFYDSFASPPSIPELSHPPKHTFSSSFSSSASSAPSTATTSSEIAPPDDPTSTPTDLRAAGEQTVPPTESPLEEQILTKLKSSDPADQEQGLLLLRQSARESVEHRATLCTAKLLAAIRPFLLSRDLEAQSNAVAALVNLSLHQPNKIPVLRSGAVPPLVSALRSDHPEARSHAAAAVFSLAVEEDNKAAIGALGALPRLLALLSRPGEEPQTCRDAALALYHLSNGCSTNRAKLAKPDAARVLVGVVKEKETSPIAGITLMLMGNISGCPEGRAALMDAGAVEVVVGIIKKLRHLTSNSNGEASSTVTARMEQCVTVLYGMSKGSLRFRGLAKGVGAEEVLMELVGEDEEEELGIAGGETMERIRDRAKRTLSAIRGQGYTDGFGGVAANGDARGAISSPVMSFPHWQRHGRHHSGVNSSEF